MKDEIFSFIIDFEKVGIFAFGVLFGLGLVIMKFGRTKRKESCKMEKSSSSGIGLGTILFLIFLVLKSTSYRDWETIGRAHV